MRSTTWGEDKFMSRNQLWRFCLTMKAFKGRVMWEGHQRHLLFSPSVVSSSWHGSMPSFPAFHFLLAFAQTHVHWVNDAIQPSHSLSPPFPPALNLFQNPGFSNELAFCIRWPKYWIFSFSINPSKEYSGLISFRMDWLDFLAVQGTQVFPSTTVQKHQFLVLSPLYGPALTSIHDYWKNHSFNIWNFVSKVMSLLFNMLSRFAIAFLPRSKCLLILWLQLRG